MNVYTRSCTAQNTSYRVRQRNLRLVSFVVNSEQLLEIVPGDRYGVDGVNLIDQQRLDTLT
eukprot:scaffold222399_cov29-Tisochrysis_lutea.AAC.8